MQLVARQPVLFLHLTPLFGRGMRQRRARRRVADDFAILKIHPVANVLPLEMDDLAKGYVVKPLGIIGDLRGKIGAFHMQMICPEPLDSMGRICVCVRPHDGVARGVRRRHQPDFDREPFRARRRMAPFREKFVEARRRTSESRGHGGIAPWDFGHRIGVAG